MRVRLLAHISGNYVDSDGRLHEYGSRLDELELPEDHALDLIRNEQAVAVPEQGPEAPEEKKEASKED